MNLDFSAILLILSHLPLSQFGWHFSVDHKRLLLNKAYTLLNVCIELWGTGPRHPNAVHMRSSFFGAFEDVDVVVINL